VPKADRDSHFFATLDFDDAQIVFQKVSVKYLLTLSVILTAQIAGTGYRPCGLCLARH
jgi:hypothetical protein